MGTIDRIKDAATLLQMLATMEDKEKLIQLQTDALDLLARTQELEIENRQLQEKLKTKASLTFDKNACWAKDEADKGPFCARCWDVDGNLVHLHHQGGANYYCVQCKTSIGPGHASVGKTIHDYNPLERADW
ncbi:MAG: hypothetical protein ABIK89_24985 [Planctomycetota bacterium]